MPTRSKWQSLPTEAINPNTLSMDRASTEEIIDLMLQEDRKTVTAVQREKDRIAIGAELITQAFRKGGRLVFVGAGTSGRLGVLEAAIVMERTGDTYAKALSRLKQAGDSVRDAIGEDVGPRLQERLTRNRAPR